MHIEERLFTEIKAEYDVAVCGGGVAGIAAALAAARCGKKVVLFERMFMLGGLATAGIITIYLPICDGLGRQVSFGLAEELLRLSISDGYEALYPENWLDSIGTRTDQDKRFKVRFNAQLFAILAEKILIENKVDIKYGTAVVSVNLQANKIKHIIVNNKSGRIGYGVSSVVDATGDADVANLSGVPTKIFNEGNKLAAWYYYVNDNGYHLNQLGISDIPDDEQFDKEKSKTLINQRFTGLDGDEISENMVLSHKIMYEDFLKKQLIDPSILPVTIPTIPQLRMTRRIIGEYELKASDNHKFFASSIGMVSSWKKRGPVYEVPFETLYSSKVKNLLCAGRCTAADDEMWDIMRVIPCCAVTGQAAGIAAALSDDVATIDICRLQDELRHQGVVLHEKDL